MMPRNNKKQVYTYKFVEGTTDKQMKIVKNCMYDRRGWKSRGYRFVPARGTADITFYFMKPTHMDSMFGHHERLRGLSVTATTPNGTSDVYFHLGNWNRPPAAFKSSSHRRTRYRMYLVNHEIGHALGFNHVTADTVAQHAAKQRRSTQPTPSCPIMLQQSKMTLPLCRNNPYVSL